MAKPEQCNTTWYKLPKNSFEFHYANQVCQVKVNENRRTVQTKYSDTKRATLHIATLK